VQFERRGRARAHDKPSAGFMPSGTSRSPS
jgi:hypothetical protein